MPLADDSPRTTAITSPITLRTFALAAVGARAVDRHGAAPDERAELAFLRSQLETVAPGRAAWADRLPQYLSDPAPADALLLDLAGQIGLTPIELLAVSLAAAVEDDLRVGHALSYIQSTPECFRPTFGLLGVALAEVAPAKIPPLQALKSGVALQSGLLTVVDARLPFPQREASVPLHFCDALNDQDGSYPGITVGLGQVPQVPLPPSIAGGAGRHARGLGASAGAALIVRSGSRAEGRSVAAAIASELGLRPAFIETDTIPGLGTWLRLRKLLPVFCYDMGPGEQKRLPLLPFYDGPILVLCGREGQVQSQGGTALDWTIPVPSLAEREALWRMSLGDNALCCLMARHHRHSSGRIAHLGRLARHQAATAGHPAPMAHDIAAAAWAAEGAGLGALAEPLRDRVGDEAMVMNVSLGTELRALLLRCQSRDGLTESLGVSARTRYRPGIKALFVGPSGTGKTLAAAWLATKLDIPLYRVDLASVTNKYIGETEKNLADLFARAEDAEVVLLFDEADSMFGKRTEIKDANDRFANAHTNYLLQRIESFDGIAILTSNTKSRIDSAFVRRLDAIIEFPLPGAEERRSLWRAHLGEAHRVTPRDLNRLSASLADLSGGQIRNAVLSAAVLAREAGRPIEYSDVLSGLAGEYKKLGQRLPGELRNALDG